MSISTPVYLNFELRPCAGDIHICLVWLWCSGTGKRIETHKGTDELPWTRRGSNSRPPDCGNSASCQLSSTSASCHSNCVKKHNSNDMAEAALDNWQPVWNAQVSISTPVCVNFELRPCASDKHICLVWFWCSGTGKRILTHKGTDKLSWTRRGWNSRPPDWGNSASCQLPSTFAWCHSNCVKNKIPKTCPRLHWTADNPSGMHRHQFQHQTYVFAYEFKDMFPRYKTYMPSSFEMKQEIAQKLNQNGEFSFHEGCKFMDLGLLYIDTP